VTRELLILPVRLRLGLSGLVALDDTPSEREDPGEGLGRDKVKSLLRVGDSTEELAEVVVAVVSVAKPSDKLDVNVVRTLEVSSSPDSDVSCEDMPSDVLEGIFGLRPGRLLGGPTDERLVLENVEDVDGKGKEDIVVTVVESPLLIVTMVVDTEYDGYGVCGWLIGRGKQEVSDNIVSNRGKLTDDRVSEEGEGVLRETLASDED
jgi:hypothetical protein